MADPENQSITSADKADTPLTKLSETDRNRQILAWLIGDQRDDWHTLDDATATLCLQQANRHLSLTPNDPQMETLATRIHEYARELGISLQPHKPRLRAAYRSLHDGDLADSRWYTEVDAALDGIERDEYERFLHLVLPSLLLQTQTAADHQLLLQSLLHHHPQTFALVYLSELGKLTRQRRIEALAAIICLWTAIAEIQATDKTQPLKLQVQERLLRSLRRWREQSLAELDEAVLQQLHHASYEQRRHWEQWRNALDTCRQTGLAAFWLLLQRRLDHWLGRR